MTAVTQAVMVFLSCFWRRQVEESFKRVMTTAAMQHEMIFYVLTVYTLLRSVI